MEIAIVGALTAIIGGAFTAVTVAIRSLQWQLRECQRTCEATEIRAEEYARMVLELVSRRSGLRRTASG